MFAWWVRLGYLRKPVWVAATGSESHCYEAGAGVLGFPVKVSAGLSPVILQTPLPGLSGFIPVFGHAHGDLSD